MLDTAKQLSRMTIVLHWLVGISIILLLAVGTFMANTETWSLYPWHKSIGILVAVVALIRVLWRMKNGWLTPVAQYTNIEINLAKLIHWVLIIGTVLMPLSGFLMSALGGNGVAFFGIELVARNPDVMDPTKVVAHNASLAGAFHFLHHWVGYILIGAIALHIAGALKHHIIDKDSTLKRMLGK